MIIFFDKNSGNIVGTIDGRIHSENHLRMWIGDKDKTDRIVVNWKKDKTGVYQPTHLQKDLMIEVDKKVVKLSDYRVGKDKKLVKK